MRTPVLCFLTGLLAVAIYSTVRAQVEKVPPPFALRNAMSFAGGRGTYEVRALQHRTGHCFVVVSMERFEVNMSTGSSDIPAIAVAVAPADWKVCHP